MGFTIKTAVAHVAFVEMMKFVIKSLDSVTVAVNQTIRIRFVKVTILFKKCFLIIAENLHNTLTRVRYIFCNDA